MSLIIAHRGFSNAFPENTAASFDAALKAGADGIELDVHLSKDNIPVVIHDKSVDRVTRHSGYIRNYTLKELEAMDNGSWFNTAFSTMRIQSLADVVTEINDATLTLNIELKPSRNNRAHLAEKVYDVVQQSQTVTQIIYSSFDLHYLKQLKAIDANVMTALLTKERLHKRLLKKHSPYIDGVHLLEKAYQSSFYTLLQSLDVYLAVYTVNDEQQLMHLLRSGCDMVITDVPNKAIAIQHALMK